MGPTTKHQQTCCYCGDTFASGEDVLADSSPLFPEWEAIRHELMPPYHRVCWCWDRIDRWLCANAPRVFQQLGKGATDEEIDLTERKYHARFPFDLRRSYKIHDGSGEAWLFEEGTLMPLQWMRSIVDWSQKPAEMVWDHIPVVTTGSGDYCGVDCNQTTGDNYGQFVWLRRHETGKQEVISSGFQYFLERFAGYVEKGRYVEKQYSTFPALVLCDD